MKSMKDEGFTLIEALIAITLMAILVVGILTMTTVHIAANASSQNHSKAMYLAEEAIEQYMSTAYDSLPTSPVVEDFGSIALYNTFKRTVAASVIDVDNCFIECSVVWKQSNYVSPSVRLKVRRTR